MTAKQSFKCNPRKSTMVFSVSFSPRRQTLMFPLLLPKLPRNIEITGHSISPLLSGIVHKNGEKQEERKVAAGEGQPQDTKAARTPWGENAGDAAPFHIARRVLGELKDGEFPGL